jgi:glycosyltransferase involved in cell wall biosynthesis
MSAKSTNISVVTPTYQRPSEVSGLLENLSRQTILPDEVILVDGGSTEENETQSVVEKLLDKLPFSVRYLRQQGGTAVQRNYGIDRASGKFIALVDDDVRLDKNFFREILRAFGGDAQNNIGGVVGYRTNQHFQIENSKRWNWYKRLGLLNTFEPGRYDFECGYPINNNLQPPFEGVRAVDFMTTACAVWRSEVFDTGLRFDPFFSDYGVLEDAHFSLNAGRKWELLQCGDALCIELRSPNGRASRRRIGYKSVVNYYYVFHSASAPLSLAKKYRFWKFQAFEFIRISLSAVRRFRWGDVQDAIGRTEGVFALIRGLEFSGRPREG